MATSQTVQVDPAALISSVTEIDQQLDTTLQPLQEQLQKLLDRYVNVSFGSFETNRKIANKIRDLLFRLGMRVKCPRENCGEPSLIRCGRVRRTKTGQFRFEHSVSDSKHCIHYTSVALPRLILVKPKPHPLKKPENH